LAGGFALFGTGSPSVPEWNRTLDPSGRFGAAMKADDLFQVESRGLIRKAEVCDRVGRLDL
jgi:hypothetical protein